MRKYSILIIISFVLLGCSVANLVVEPYANLEISAKYDINPDSNGRPSPIVVYIFELSEKTIFESQDFFSIYESYENVLGPDLINKYEVSLTPGKNEIYSTSMSPKTEYLGIVAAFRDIENSHWRQVIKVDDTGYHTYQILLEDLSLVVQ